MDRIVGEGLGFLVIQVFLIGVPTAFWMLSSGRHLWGKETREKIEWREGRQVSQESGDKIDPPLKGWRSFAGFILVGFLVPALLLSRVGLTSITFVSFALAFVNTIVLAAEFTILVGLRLTVLILYEQTAVAQRIEGLERRLPGGPEEDPPERST